MKDPESDDVVWQLPRVGADDDAPPPPDSILEAYRAGQLSQQEEARVEWSLVGSRRGRERLAELGGVRLDRPSKVTFIRRPIITTILAAAAVFAVVALLVLGGGRTRTVPEFEIHAYGLAATRADRGGARAFADGRVHVVVEPRGDEVPGLTFAAYRLEASELTRLAEPADVTIEINRGSAALAAAAERLVGREVGTRPFFVLVTNRSSLPARVAVNAEAPEAALTRAAGGRVYRVPLTVLDPRESVP